MDPLVNLVYAAFYLLIAILERLGFKKASNLLSWGCFGAWLFVMATFAFIFLVFYALLVGASALLEAIL